MSMVRVGLGVSLLLVAGCVANVGEVVEEATSALSAAGTVTQLSMGGDQTSCAVLTGGELRCWGKNSYGQVGNGTNGATAIQSSPVTVIPSGVTKVVQALYHTCAILTGGELRCWGLNTSGQIGNGLTTSQLTPVTVIASGVVDVAMSKTATCALFANGKLQCWGDNDNRGLGNGGGMATYNTPQTIIPSGVTQIAMGSGITGPVTCAILAGGELRCWGDDGGGSVGVSSIPQLDYVQHVPATVIPSGVTSVRISRSDTGDVPVVCATLSSGALDCWGISISGGVGNGSTQIAWTPVTVIPSGVTQVQLGSYDLSCAILIGGQLQCWGTGAQVGRTITSTSLFLTPGVVIPSGVTRVSNGADTTCAILTGGQLECWGANGSGELANGTTSRSTAPVSVFASGIAQVAISGPNIEGTICAVSTRGALQCWGSNRYGSVGDGTRVDHLTPTTIINGQAPPPAIATLLNGGQVTAVLSLPIGTLVAGWRYTVRYSAGAFATTGLSSASNRIVTASYSNANIDLNQVSLWGIVFVVNASGQLTLNGVVVGTIQ